MQKKGFQKAKSKHWVLPLKPFIKCHNNGINWRKGKNPKGMMALVSHLSPIINQNSPEKLAPFFFFPQ